MKYQYCEKELLTACISRLEEDAGPDPFLVDQIEASLYHLHALHINTTCEER